MPTATLNPAVGLGITRNIIQASGEQLGFNFESTQPAPNYADQPRFFGILGNGESFIELIGPPENLRSVGVMVLLPYNNPDAVNARNTILVTVAYLAAPSCKEKLDQWLTAENLSTAASGSTLKTTCGKLAMRLVGSQASDGALVSFTVN